MPQRIHWGIFLYMADRINIMRYRIILVLILVSASLPGCRVVSQANFDQPWQYSDIRALDSAEASAPGMDILAVYLRQTSSTFPSKEFQIRVDFLDLSYLPECDVTIAFDTQSGGNTQIAPSLQTNIAWDFLMVISASLRIQLLDAQFNPLPATNISVYRDPIQDTLTINFSDQLFRRPLSVFNFQVFTTSPALKTLVDSSNRISSAGYPPHQAEALMAFWNTFPAFTPVQALRRWDGAHTGPRGGRHGLFNLLSAANDHSIPLLLLDLKYPSSLSALDYVDGLNLVRDMHDRKLLILPNPQPVLSYAKPVLLTSQILDEEMTLIKNTATVFNISASKSVFSNLAPFSDPNGSSTYSTVFLMRSPQPSSNHPFPEFSLSSCAGQTVVPITISSDSDEFYDQTGTNGLSISLRRALIDNAIRNTLLTSTEPIIMTLGGELPRSSWGIPDEAEAAFTYFENHPWIHIVGENDLVLSTGSNPNHCPVKIKTADLSLDRQTIDMLKASPQNLAFTQAIRTLMSLTTPIYPDTAGLLELRKNYLGQADVYLEVARWLENRTPKSDCKADIDMDGRSECTLASDRFFLILDPQNGSLQYAFIFDQGKLHQIIGPSSLLATGLSSPDNWNLSSGDISDPVVIPGAFWNKNKSYQIEITNDAIQFTSPTGIKSYTLSTTGINIQISEPADKPYQIPFLFDPWVRFTPHWIDNFANLIENNGTASFTWKYSDNSSFILTSNNPLAVTSFADSYDYKKNTENPDMDYPAGHFLPMPLILGEIPNFSPPLMINLTVR
jgi:hypothetical protein